MRQIALFAVGFFLAVGSIRAQQVPQAPLGTTPDDSVAEPARVASMTPREIAEMHANILMARKDYAEAAKSYQTILIDDPHNTTILNQVGIAYLQLGNADRAEHYFKLILRVNKADSSALNNLGALEYSIPRYGRAIKYYQKAIASGTAVPQVYANLAYAYCAIKAYPKAMAAFAKALALDPEVFDHRGTGGTILQQRSAPDPGSLHFVLAKSFAKSGDAERAARYLKLARDEGYKDFRAAQKDPDFALVIKDPRVQDVLQRRPGYVAEPPKPVSN